MPKWALAPKPPRSSACNRGRRTKPTACRRWYCSRHLPSMTPKARQQPGHATTASLSKWMATPFILAQKTKQTHGQSPAPNFLIRNNGQTVIKHKDATGHALKVDNGYISGHDQSNWSGASWSHNVLFRASTNDLWSAKVTARRLFR